MRRAKANHNGDCNCNRGPSQEQDLFSSRLQLYNDMETCANTILAGSQGRGRGEECRPDQSWPR